MSVQRSPLRAAGLIAITALVGFALDLAGKQWALANLQADRLHKLIPNLLGMTLVTNTGTAFGMWRSEKLVGLLLPPAICIGIACWIINRERSGRPLSQLERIGFGLILGGACGNMFDRFTRGQVIDFLYFAFWTAFPVFNIADALIDVGVGLILVHTLFLSSKTVAAQKSASGGGPSDV